MNIWKSGILGVVVGDALGCPVQGEARDEVARHPVTDMRGHGTFNLPAGSWTDDSALTLALLESIWRIGGIDYNDIMDNFVRWLDNGAFTPFGYAYDIGRGTMKAIRKYKRCHMPHKAGGTGESNNGNGSLMRIMPAVLYCIEKGMPDREAVEVIHKVGSLTHAHIRANIACGMYYFMVSAILNGEDVLAARLRAGLERGFAFYEADLHDHDELGYYGRLRDLGAFAALPDGVIRGSGYVVEALEAAVWALLNSDSFEGALLKAVNLGDDTDTVAAIAGGLAGLYYGYDAIPAKWVAALQRRDWINDLFTKYGRGMIGPVTLENINARNIDKALDAMRKFGLPKYIQVCTLEGSGLEGISWEYLRYDYSVNEGPAYEKNDWEITAIEYKPDTTPESVVRDIKEMLVRGNDLTVRFEERPTIVPILSSRFEMP